MESLYQWIQSLTTWRCYLQEIQVEWGWFRDDGSKEVAKKADCLWISCGALRLPSSLKCIGSGFLPGLEELAPIMALFVHISHKVSNRCNDRGPWVTKFSQMRYQGLPIHFQCCKQVQNASKTHHYVVGILCSTVHMCIYICPCIPSVQPLTNRDHSQKSYNKQTQTLFDCRALREKNQREAGILTTL